MIDTVFTFLKSYLATARPGLVPSFGESELSRRVEGFERVVVAPGGPTGALGKVSAPKYLGGDPREIASVDELFRVYVGAYDPTVATEDVEGQSLGQYAATLALWKLVFAGLRGAARNFWPVSVDWKVGVMAAPFGRALLTVATVRDPVRDWAEGEETTSIGPVAPIVTSKIEEIET